MLFFSLLPTNFVCDDYFKTFTIWNNENKTKYEKKNPNNKQHASHSVERNKKK